jgi:phospholipase C
MVAGGAGVMLSACSGPAGRPPASSGARTRTTVPGMAFAGAPTTTRTAGSLPFPHLAAGTDTLPQIEHIVVVMMENHSYDNILGMSGRGDGFRLNNGVPAATNPDGHGNLVHAFPMPTPCQPKSHPSNSWSATHASYAGGRMDGFVTSASGPVSMGYFTSADLPFTVGLAQVFPVADRYFCSVMAQTYPNRRYLLAGTSLGLTIDILPTVLPPNGTIFDTLNRHGIAWKNYYTNLPTAGVLIPLLKQAPITSRLAPIASFYSDAAAGRLPAFCIVDPDYNKQSEEDPQDVQYGDQFLGQVVNAVMDGPGWSKTLLVWTYDESGGYYDHVPPPAAVPPDDVAPQLLPVDPPGKFDRYGLRVPSGVVSPYARKNYVSHVTYDHTSVLKLVETKWNLPALTARDANAANLLDMVDLEARPAFLVPPQLPAPADPVALSGCLTTGPGVIPPRRAVTPA